MWGLNIYINILLIHNNDLVTLNGGGAGIRTLGRLSPSSVFKTGAFNHSATPPTDAPFSLRFSILKGRN